LSRKSVGSRLGKFGYQFFVVIECLDQFVFVGQRINGFRCFGRDVFQPSSKPFRIRSTDSGGLFTEKTFSVDITDVNEAAGSLSLSNPTESLLEGTGDRADSGSVARPRDRRMPRASACT